MCRFISVVVDSTADLAGLEALARSCRLGFSRYENSSVRRQLRPTEILILATAGHCDCGCPLGSASGGGRKDSDPEAERRRLRNLGWSETKIDRALAQKADAGRRAKGSGEAGAGLEEWLTFLRGARAHARVTSIGVFVHMYRGQVATEEIDLSRADRVSLAGFEANRLAELKEDVLYEFNSLH